MNPQTNSADGPRRERSYWVWIRWLVVGVAVVGMVPAIVSAHAPSAEASVGFRFPILVAGSAVIGSIGGFSVVAYRSRDIGTWLTSRRFVGAIGVGLSGLAGVVLLPIVASRPVLSGGSVLGGVLGAAMLSAHNEEQLGPVEVASATGALTLHQLIEGVVLAAAYVAGGVVGIAAAIFLTLHTVAETATVAGAYATAGQYRRGTAAVVLMQAVYVVAAGFAFAVAWSIPPLAEDLTAAIVAGVLLIVGLNECWSVVRSPLVTVLPFDWAEQDTSVVEGHERR